MSEQRHDNALTLTEEDLGVESERVIETAAVEPAHGEPTGREPAHGEPSSREPASGEPGHAESADTRPRKPRRTVRIPDDEVVRPSQMPPPVAPRVDDQVITAQRIIQIGQSEPSEPPQALAVVAAPTDMPAAPPVDAPPASPPVASFPDTKPVPQVEADESWTPYQPTVEPVVTERDPVERAADLRRTRLADEEYADVVTTSSTPDVAFYHNAEDTVRAEPLSLHEAEALLARADALAEADSAASSQPFAPLTPPTAPEPPGVSDVASELELDAGAEEAVVSEPVPSGELVDESEIGLVDEPSQPAPRVSVPPPPPRGSTSQPPRAVADSETELEAEPEQVLDLDTAEHAKPPPMRPRAASVPHAPPAVAAAPVASGIVAPPRPKIEAPTLATLGGGAGHLAPAPLTDSAAKKKARPWWEELFNDDFVRTGAKGVGDNVPAEVAFIEESLGMEKGATLLDLACGTGKHAIELSKRGYNMVGFDLSLAMLARAADLAQAENRRINFVQGDMREMTFDGAFDGVYCWNTSFGYFEEDKNALVAGLVHRALRKGGQFLLDVVNRDYVIRESPTVAWFEGDGCICMDEMHVDFITSRMRAKRTMMFDDGRSREIEYSIRLYSLHELGRLLHEQGFRVVEVSGLLGTPGVFFGCQSPRTIILAEKR